MSDEESNRHHGGKGSRHHDGKESSRHHSKHSHSRPHLKDREESDLSSSNESDRNHHHGKHHHDSEGRKGHHEQHHKHHHYGDHRDSGHHDHHDRESNHGHHGHSNGGNHHHHYYSVEHKYDRDSLGDADGGTRVIYVYPRDGRGSPRHYSHHGDYWEDDPQDDHSHSHNHHGHYGRHDHYGRHSFLGKSWGHHYLHSEHTAGLLLGVLGSVLVGGLAYAGFSWYKNIPEGGQSLPPSTGMNPDARPSQAARLGSGESPVRSDGESTWFQRLTRSRSVTPVGDQSESGSPVSESDRKPRVLGAGSGEEFLSPKPRGKRRNTARKEFI